MDPRIFLSQQTMAKYHAAQLYINNLKNKNIHDEAISDEINNLNKASTEIDPILTADSHIREADYRYKQFTSKL